MKYIVAIAALVLAGCDELCRKRAERNRWHARQKDRFEKLNPGVSFTEWRKAK
jgi:hypothetical protein